MANPTLTELRTAVAAKGYDVANEGIDECINSAYREIVAARRWPFTSANSTSLTTTAGVDTVNLSGIANLVHVDAVRITSTSAPYELEFLPVQELKALANEDTGTDVPDYWTVYAGQILLYPAPNGVFTLSVDYTTDITALVNGTDAILIPRRYMDAVVWGAAAELAARKRDYASVDRFEKKRDDAVLRMTRAYGLEQRQGGRRVRETGFWDSQA